MEEANRPDLIKPTDSGLERLAADLQGSLLQFRLENYKKVGLPQILGSEKLRPRTRDLLLSLATPCAAYSERCDFLLRCFLYRDRVSWEPLSPVQTAVLRALFFMVHQHLTDYAVWVADFTDLVNRLLAYSDEHLRLQPRKVGAALTSLGFINRERTNRGWKVWLEQEDRKRVHELANNYGIGPLSEDFPSLPPNKCPMCKEGAEKEG